MRAIVGQDGILRGDWQSPRVRISNRHAAYQAALQDLAERHFSAA
jgi:hypothetical protein